MKKAYLPALIPATKAEPMTLDSELTARSITIPETSARNWQTKLFLETPPSTLNAKYTNN